MHEVIIVMTVKTGDYWDTVMWHRVVWQVITNNSKELAASLCSVEGVGCGVFLWNIGNDLLHYPASYTRRLKSLLPLWFVILFVPCMVFKIGSNLNENYKKEVTVDDVYFKGLAIRA